MNDVFNTEFELDRALWNILSILRTNKIVDCKTHLVGAFYLLCCLRRENMEKQTKAIPIHAHWFWLQDSNPSNDAFNSTKDKQYEGDLDEELRVLINLRKFLFIVLIFFKTTFLELFEKLINLHNLS